MFCVSLAASRFPLPYEFLPKLQVNGKDVSLYYPHDERIRPPRKIEEVNFSKATWVGVGGRVKAMAGDFYSMEKGLSSPPSKNAGETIIA